MSQSTQGTPDPSFNNPRHVGLSQASPPLAESPHWNDFDNFIIDDSAHFNSFQQGFHIQPNIPQNVSCIPSDSASQPADKGLVLDPQLSAFQGFPDSGPGSRSVSNISTPSGHVPRETQSLPLSPSYFHNEAWPEYPTGLYNADLPEGLSAGVLSSNLTSPSTQNLESDVYGHSAYFPASDIPDEDAAAAGRSRSRFTSTQELKSAQSLPRRRSRYRIRGSGQMSTPVYIPNAVNSRDPMQRWQDSPPEDEPASISAIMKALESNPGGEANQEISSACNRSSFQGHDPFIGYRRSASAASSRSGASASSRHSASSTKSTNSATARTPLAASNSTRGRVRKTKREAAKRVPDDTRRPFCCTFCCDKFKTKYDWARHEKSLHLNLQSWVCTPHGGSVASPITHRQHCAYCNALDPTPDHLEQHNHNACSNQTRSFRRKDHLVQHLRLTHHLDTMPLIEDWITVVPDFQSRCGFCDNRLASWEERIEHLATHFRKGATMDDWRGEHEFPDSIAARVTNELPPYLIGVESRTIVPFSATNSNVKDHYAQISTRVDPVRDDETQGQDDAALASSFQQLRADDVSLDTFTELLTLHLSRYARQQVNEGSFPTDEMFQQEARRLLYESEDSWNQTIADNPEWISAFRRRLARPGDTTQS